MFMFTYYLCSRLSLHAPHVQSAPCLTDSEKSDTLIYTVQNVK